VISAPGVMPARSASTGIMGILPARLSGLVLDALAGAFMPSKG
jgi:hypothetical protein